MSKKYYICITPFFPSLARWQGAYVLDQVKAIQRNSDYEVVVFKTNTLSSKEEEYEVDGVHVYSIRPLLMPSYILNGLTEGLVAHMFVCKLKALGIDPKYVSFVHCHTASHGAFVFGVRRVNQNAKVMIQFHDLDPYTLRNGKWADKRWNVRYRAQKSLSAFNRADLLISISTPVQDNLLAFPKARPQEVYPSYIERLEHLKDFPRVKPKRMYILYNGVNTKLFHNASKGLKRATDSSKLTSTNSAQVSTQCINIFRIGCIANFQELKDHITLIKAFGMLHEKGYHNIVLSLLGSGETKEECVHYLEEHDLIHYVEWLSEVEHDKLPAYYQSLDLFVLPSVYEGFGCVYTEAYACGVPFMGVYDQGAAEMIAPEERYRWLIQPHDHEQLAKLIEQYYMERYKQKLCQLYDIDELIQKFLKEIEKI